MKHCIAPAALCLGLLLASAGVTLAASPPAPGQPSQSCQDLSALAGVSLFPGNTGNSPGSAFNGSAGSVYANGPGTGGPGTATGTGHITNPTAVAQYDVACFQQFQKLP